MKSKPKLTQNQLKPHRKTHPKPNSKSTQKIKTKNQSHTKLRERERERERGRFVVSTNVTGVADVVGAMCACVGARGLG